MENQNEIDPKIYSLYDEYCHSGMSRREFLSKASAISVIGGITGYAMAQSLLPDYAKAQEVKAADGRLLTEYVTYDSPGGNSGKMKGYLTRPKGIGPFPAVLIVHENRGLNPYIEDVARRAALAGFIALAPDALSVVGGYPGDDEKGKVMQAKLDQNKILIDMKNSAYFLKKHALSNGKLGVTGFCYGGMVANWLAVELGSDLLASAPFYGKAPKLEEVGKIRAKLLMNYAENDEGVNATRIPYEEALKKNHVNFESFVYKGTQHGFHNYSTPRYNKEAAALAWDRTLLLFRNNLK
jgi:carboxymethylenebutenolidase